MAARAGAGSAGGVDAGERVGVGDVDGCVVRGVLVAG